MMCLNKILNNVDEELVKIQGKLEGQESKIRWHQQQIKELQQKDANTKTEDKLEITKLNNMLWDNTKEIFCLITHKNILVTKIHKLKIIQKTEHSSEGIKGKLLENKEENRNLRIIMKVLRNDLRSPNMKKVTRIIV